jgi:hypothetical protein
MESPGILTHSAFWDAYPWPSLVRDPVTGKRFDTVAAFKDLPPDVTKAAAAVHQLVIAHARGERLLGDLQVSSTRVCIPRPATTRICGGSVISVCLQPRGERMRALAAVSR